MSNWPTNRSHATDPLLRMIAWLKLGKCTLLVAAGVAALRLRGNGLAWETEHWAARIAAHYHVTSLADGVRWLCRMDAPHKDLLAAACFGYAALFATEGLGLWLDIRWAEWLTIVATALLIPLELYELFQKVTAVRCLALVVNLLVVVYLVRRVRTKAAEDEDRRVAGAPLDKHPESSCP